MSDDLAPAARRPGWQWGVHLSGSPSIEGLRATPYRLPLRRPWASARGRERERAGWILAASGAGATGWGECAPWPAAGTEPPEEAARWLARAAAELTGQPLPAALARLERSGCTPAARCALETAFLDLEARLAGVPLAARLAAQPASRVPVNAFLGPLTAGAEARARRAAAAGYRVLKVKVGLAAPRAELGALERLCGALPAGVRLRLDANGVWPGSLARALLRALAAFPVESVEEPTTAPDARALARLRARAPLPIAIDESLDRLGARAVLAARAADRVVLKPMARGGPRWALELARRAAAAGIDCVVTTTVDAAVGSLAAAHLAAALPRAAGVAHGLATSGWLARDVAAAPPPRAGLWRLPDRPGLGVDLDG